MSQVPIGLAVRRPKRSRFTGVSIGLMLVTLLAVIAWLFTATVGVGIDLLGLLFLGAGVLAYFFVAGLIHLDVARRLSAVEVEFGERLSQITTCRPRNLLSRLAANMLTIEVVDEQVIPGMQTSGVVGTIGADGTLLDEREVVCTQWGAFWQGPTVTKIVGVYDAFERGHGAGEAERVVVLPPVVTLSSCWLDCILFEDQPAQQLVLDDDPWSRRRPQPPVIAGRRRYRPGDPLNRVDDRIFARTGNPRDLMIVTYARPPALTRMHLLVDSTIDSLQHTLAQARVVQQTLAVAALALAAHWLRRPELEVTVLTGPFGMTEVLRTDASLEDATPQLRQIQQVLATTMPQMLHSGVREQIIDQLDVCLANAYGARRLQASTVEVAVLLTAARPAFWQVLLQTLLERGIPCAVVAATPCREEWPVPALPLFSSRQVAAQIPSTVEGWEALIHTLTEPASADTSTRRASLA
jgi:hypothetical protein